uniref:CN hydrolase domain-containing protein n=1 Tax=Daphnia galeata TaxID=27404 RepID=A0A8J2R9L3_9CRUS|nr:unnamed protein product [Daphnia galeata]
MALVILAAADRYRLEDLKTCGVNGDVIILLIHSLSNLSWLRINLDGHLMKSYSELAVHNREWISVGGFHNKCYDVRSPDFSLSLARMGADIITYPSAFTVTTGLAHWESLLRARATETQCFVVAAAQTGIS